MQRTAFLGRNPLLLLPHRVSPSHRFCRFFNSLSIVNNSHKTLTFDNSDTTTRNFCVNRKLLPLRPPLPPFHSISFSTAPKLPTNDVNPTITSSVKDEPRILPTRHSRHHIPEVAPIDSIDKMCDEILKSVPGSLFAYSSDYVKLTKLEEYKIALTKCNQIQQQVEYILRGYNSTFSGSLVQYTHSDRIDNNTSDTNISPLEERIEKMEKLLERMEEEGNVYLELRSRIRSQLVNFKLKDDGEDRDDEHLVHSEEKGEKDVDAYGAPPGPSTIMYDLILDAIAVSIPHLSISSSIQWLEKSRAISERAVERHTLDIDAGEMDKINLENSIPSAVTFNAVIRAAAYAPYDGVSEQLRDVALDAAFMTYSSMHKHSVTHRNSATYCYILQTVGKYLPVGPSMGNIAHALFLEACVEERVLDEIVIDALLKDVTKLDCNGGAEEKRSLGRNFDDWIKDFISDKYEKEANGFGFKIKWSSKKKLRRYDRRFAMY